MTSRLLLSPFGMPGATRRLLETALQGQTGSDFSGITYIAPTPRKVRAAQLEFVDLVGREACIAPNFATLRQHVRARFNRTTTAHYLDPELKTVLLMRLMREKRPGYARAVGNFIKLVREYRPDLSVRALAARFNELLADYDEPRKRLLSAVRVMERYLALLEEKNWIDDEGIFAAFASETGKAEPVSNTLILDGFYDLTRLEEQALARIIRDSKSVFALSYADARAGQTYEVAQGFREFLKRTRPDIKETWFKPDREIRRAATCLEFSSREDEVEGIARDLKLKLRNKELSSDSVLVVFPNFIPYAPIAARVFERYKIPCTIYPELNLGASPLVVAVLQLLEAVGNDFPRIPLVSVLTSTWFGRVSVQTRARINRLSLDAGIIKGERNWRHVVRRSLERREVESESEELEKLAPIQSEVNLVLGFAKEFGVERNTLAGHAQGLKTLLARLEFAVAPAQDSALEPDLVAHRRLLYNLLDSLAQFEHEFGEQRIGLAEFTRLLGFLLRNLAVPPEHEPSGVLVCGTLESRGLECEQLYYGGLVEGELPSRFQHDPLLPDWVRRDLNLPNIDRHNLWQQLHFFRLVNTPVRDPFLSFPDTEEDTILLPSPFLEGKIEFAPAVPGFFSEEDQQRWLGARSGVRLDERLRQFDLDQEPEVLAELGRRYGPDQSISVTRLESYQYCPFRFYLQDVLGLEPLQEPGYQLEPTRWGTIFHRVLERLYAHGPLPVKELPGAIRRLVPAVMREEGLSGFWRQAIMRVFEGILPEFVAIEQQFRDEEFEPTKTEHKLRYKVADDLSVRGRLDRLDQWRVSGKATRVRIIDYKTGRLRVSTNAVLRGEHVQLPLYALMLEKTHPGFEVENMGVFGLNEMRVVWLANDKNPVSSLAGFALQHARDIASAIRQAKFAESVATNCHTCPHQFLCPARARTAQREE